jgi:hypothetical protein
MDRSMTTFEKKRGEGEEARDWRGMMGVSRLPLQTIPKLWGTVGKVGKVE